MSDAYVYALIDPRDNLPRYIGKTVNPQNRLRQHLKKAMDDTQSAKDHWIKDLILNGMQPIPMILETTSSGEAATIERDWITLTKEHAWPLVNSTNGGEGCCKTTPVEPITVDIECNGFGDWLKNELKHRGWSMRELARRIDITHGQISKIISEKTRPGERACISIAEGFCIPTETVLRRAGILPALPKSDAYTKLTETIRALNEADRTILLRIATALASNGVADAPVTGTAGGGNGKEHNAQTTDA